MSTSVLAQTVKADSVLIRSLFDEALAEGESYENLRSLCKDVGHRLTGSPQAVNAVAWGEKVMIETGLDNVRLQLIEAPVWVRGDVQSVSLIHEGANQLQVSALGGSIGTNGKLNAKVIEVQSREELADLGEENIKGKIVFYNRPMDPRPINTFESYGGCVDQRYWGAVEAAKYGAVAVLVRSMSHLEHDEHPHTGSMTYVDSIPKIPAAALSTASANTLHEMLGFRPNIDVVMELNCKTLENTFSHNVIGEIKGSVDPDKIIVIGGHLDSWDVGEGAHDDGAGIVHSLESLRLLKEVGYKPRHTIRVVFFMNEENGNMGGKTYAKEAKKNNEYHVAALESDRGGFSPRGFTVKSDEDGVAFIQGFADVLEPYNLHYFEAGFAGVDIYPLALEENIVNDNMLMLGLVPDSQRYFDFHHADTDIFENVNKRELELGCASMAAMIYLIDKYYKDPAGTTGP